MSHFSEKEDDDSNNEKLVDRSQVWFGEITCLGTLSKALLILLFKSLGKVIFISLNLTSVEYAKNNPPKKRCMEGSVLKALWVGSWPKMLSELEISWS